MATHPVNGLFNPDDVPAPSASSQLIELAMSYSVGAAQLPHL
jgi:hypothetical protein